MTLFFHELKRDRVKVIVWTAVIASMLLINIALYPQMAPQMNEMTDMFSDMGEFTAAFNMDKVNFGEFNGYFAVECGNVLGLGGAFFAALLGIAALAKEKRERTAEFLLTHPISRTRVVAEKLAAVIAEILILNLIVALTAVVCIYAIGQEMEAKLLFNIFLSYLLMQIEIACILFGISAFLRGSGIGIGLGVAFVLYFISIVANLTESAAFLRYITPFSYADSTAIASTGSIELKYLMPGMAYTVIGALAAFLQYNRKDIHA